MKTSLALLALALPAAAQDFNCDVGLSFGTPSNAYGGAASQPGFWNPIDMTGPVMTPVFVSDLAGNLTTATIEFNKDGNGEFMFDNALTTGDDQALMDDMCDVGGTAVAVVKYTFRGLQNGSYDVRTYAWAPDDPVNFITDIEVIGGAAGLQNCGGADWTGAHVLGETYVMDTISVTNGEIRIRATFVSGAATVNGFQITFNGGGCNSNPVQYCTAGTSSNGCQATLSSVGTASATAASGFTLVASGVEGDKDGLYFQGTNGRQANSWGNSSSFQCVVPPVKRLGLLGKSGTSGACDGSFSQDLNAYWQAFPNKNPGAGSLVQAQLWYRDPANTSNQTTSLSEALEFSVCP